MSFIDGTLIAKRNVVRIFRKQDLFGRRCWNYFFQVIKISSCYSQSWMCFPLVWSTCNWSIISLPLKNNFPESSNFTCMEWNCADSAPLHLPQVTSRMPPIRTLDPETGCGPYQLKFYWLNFGCFCKGTSMIRVKRKKVQIWQWDLTTFLKLWFTCEILTKKLFLKCDLSMYCKPLK